MRINNQPSNKEMEVTSGKREWTFLVPFSDSYALNALLGCDSETS